VPVLVLTFDHRLGVGGALNKH